jgi:hypothetical protein
VGIHFSIPGDGKDKHFRLEGNIVRVMDFGIGIKFAKGIDTDAMKALLKFGESDLQASKPNPTAVTRLAVTRPATSQVKPVGRESATSARPTNVVSAAANRVIVPTVPVAPIAKAAAARQQGSAGAGQAAAPGARQSFRQRPRYGSLAAATTHLEPLSSGIRLPGPITPAETKQVISEVRRRVVRVLPEMISTLFSYMDDELLRLARDAKSNAVQSEYFAAMSNLEKAKREVSQAFSHDILDQIDHPKALQTLLDERKAAKLARKQTEAKKTKLMRVDTDDFEDWLAIANIISCSERANEKQLQEIRVRMGMLVDAWAHKEANPLGATVFCYAFDEATHRIDLTKDIRQKTYVGFEAKAVPLFFKLYADTTKILEDSQLFPDADESFFTPSAIKAKTAAGAPSMPAPAETGDEEPREESSPLAGSQSDQQQALEDAFARSQSINEPEYGRFGVTAKADIREELAEPRNELRQQFGSNTHAGRASEPAAASERGHRESPVLSDIYTSVDDLLAGQNAVPEDAQGNETVSVEEVNELLRAIQPVADGEGRLNVRELLQRLEVISMW